MTAKESRWHNYRIIRKAIRERPADAKVIIMAARLGPIQWAICCAFTVARQLQEAGKLKPSA